MSYQVPVDPHGSRPQNGGHAHYPGPGGGEAGHFLNPDVPVLSFLYALYCDAEFSEREFEIWKTDPSNYRGYFRDYIRVGGREFPRAAQELIAAQVPMNRPVQGGRYKPTWDQARECVNQYLVPELTLQPENGQRNRSPRRATFNPDRPVLSSLGIYFLNLEERLPVELTQLGVPAEVAAVMRDVRWAFGRPYFELQQVAVLAPAIQKELTTGEAAW
jgi:hypothetical protein